MELIIIILATWRLSSLITFEDGPFDIFLKFREKLGIEEELDENGLTITSVPSRFAPQMLSCMWCTSMWVGAIFFLLPPTISLTIALPFAYSTGAILIDNYIHGG